MQIQFDAAVDLDSSEGQLIQRSQQQLHIWQERRQRVEVVDAKGRVQALIEAALCNADIGSRGGVALVLCMCAGGGAWLGVREAGRRCL